jgi:hypothetical protein
MLVGMPDTLLDIIIRSKSDYSQFPFMAETESEYLRIQIQIWFTEKFRNSPTKTAEETLHYLLKEIKRRRPLNDFYP